MEDKQRIDRFDDHGASSLDELSVELGQFKEDCIESATCLSRLDNGGIAFREACPAKRLADILGDSERIHQRLQTAFDLAI